MNLKYSAFSKSLKMDRSAIYHIFIFMHKRIAKIWIALFHANKTPSFSFCVSILLIYHYWKSLWKKMHCFQKSFQPPWRECLLQKQCVGSNKCSAWMGKTKGFQKLCSRLCPKALRARFGEKLSRASEAKRIKSVSRPSLVFMSGVNHLKEVFYSFLWESCIQEGGLQCLGSKPST